MTLDELIGSGPGGRVLPPPDGTPAPASPEITAVVQRPDDAVPGALFCAIPGLRADGHDFAGAAVARGAVALLVERPLDLPVPQVVVGDADGCGTATVVLGRAEGLRLVPEGDA